MMPHASGMCSQHNTKNFLVWLPHAVISLHTCKQVKLTSCGVVAGISTGLCVLILLVSKSFFHGPMMLLANFVALPVNVSALPFTLRAFHTAWTPHKTA